MFCVLSVEATNGTAPMANGTRTNGVESHNDTVMANGASKLSKKARRALRKKRQKENKKKVKML